MKYTPKHMPQAKRGYFRKELEWISRNVEEEHQSNAVIPLVTITGTLALRTAAGNHGHCLTWTFVRCHGSNPHRSRRPRAVGH